MRYTIWSCSVFKAQEINTKLHITYEDENDCIFSFSYQFISFLLFAVHHFFLLYVYRVLHFGWQNEWVGNLLITYVSCILRVCVVCVFFCYILFILYAFSFYSFTLCIYQLALMHMQRATCCCCSAKCASGLQVLRGWYTTHLLRTCWWSHIIIIT